MPGYCTPSQIIAALPGLTLDSSIDMDEGAIEEQINNIAVNEMDGAALTQGFDLDDLTDHQSDLFAGINAYPVEAEIILTRSTDIPADLLRYRNAQRNFGDWQISLLTSGQLQQSLLAATPIPRVELATIEQCCAVVADFEPTLALIPESEEEDAELIANPNKSYPWREAITLWIRWASAFVYSLAAVPYPHKLPSDPSTLTVKEQTVYRAPVINIVGSRIIRVIKAQVKAAAVDTEANLLMSRGKEQILAIAAGQHNQVFLNG
jgi:hypothetical protein